MSNLYVALGLMSGTSLDGIDIALLHTDGQDKLIRGPAASYPYKPEQQALLQQALFTAKKLRKRDERCAFLYNIEQQLTRWHSEAVLKFLDQHQLDASNIDVIGFHGQTILHRPEQGLTVQLGDGGQLAKSLNIPVVYDMRAADVAAGGQGAPLVPIYHQALAGFSPYTGQAIAFLNIGGVANVTWVSADRACDKLLAFDTGPGNALLNDWALQKTGIAVDLDGKLALQGRVHGDRVEEILHHGFFKQPPPKSLDRNDFQHINLADLSVEDGAATLTELTAATIFAAEIWMPTKPALYIICGGGRKNPALMQALQHKGLSILSSDVLGLDGDAMEAEAWAYLAVRALEKLPLTFPGTTRVKTAQTGGVIVGMNR